MTLVPRGGKGIHARVLECGPDTLLVAIMVPIGPLSASHLDGLVLEFVSPQGRVRLSGTTTIEDPSDPDVLRIDAPRSIEVLQEREYVRIRSARPAIVYAGTNRSAVESYTVDLSGGGFLLAGPDTLKIGEDVQFKITLEPRAADQRHGRGRAGRSPGASRRRLQVDHRARPPPSDPLHLRLPARRTSARAAERIATMAAADTAIQPELTDPVAASPEPRAPEKKGAAKAEKKGGKADKKDKKDKGDKKGKGDGEDEQLDGGAPSIAAYPRAARSVALVKGWGGLAGFVLGGYLSLPTNTLAGAGLRALVAGIVCYVVAWGGAVFVWRRLVMIELRSREHQLAVTVHAARTRRELPAPGAERSAARPAS